MGTDAAGDYRLLHIAAFMALFCVGTYAASFGPVLPFIAEDLDVALDTAGLMLTALFLGSITASAVIAIALHARDMRLLTVAGLCAMVGGVILIGFAPNFALALFGGVLLGAGDGLVIAALHILMSISSRDVPSAINRLNLYFAYGAFLGPIWAGGVLELTGDRWIVYAGIAVNVALTLAAMLAAESPGHTVVAPKDEHSILPGNPTAWFMGGILFLYVGAEFGLGAWVSEYARETTGASVFGAAVLTSGYWAALALGRITSGWYFSQRRDPSFLLAASVAGAGLAALLLAVSTGNIGISSFAAFAAGLCLGPVWPTTVAIASEGGAANATAATVTIGNAGGLAIPWLQGRVLVGAGAAEGVAVTAVLCAIMLAGVLAFRLQREAVS